MIATCPSYCCDWQSDDKWDRDVHGDFCPNCKEALQHECDECDSLIAMNCNLCDECSRPPMPVAPADGRCFGCACGVPSGHRWCRSCFLGNHNGI